MAHPKVLKLLAWTCNHPTIDAYILCHYHADARGASEGIVTLPMTPTYARWSVRHEILTRVVWKLTVTTSGLSPPLLDLIGRTPIADMTNFP
jgi:hypothetical protein